MTKLRAKLLWIDGIGAVFGGLVMFALLDWLTGIYGLPRGLMVAVAVTNVAYGAYSLSLARLAVRPAGLIRLLAVANIAWGLGCWVLAARHFDEASLFGIGHLVLEGLYVGSLGCLEWRWREELRIQTSPDEMLSERI